MAVRTVVISPIAIMHLRNPNLSYDRPQRILHPPLKIFWKMATVAKKWSLFMKVSPNDLL